jgi:uncharacterized protein (DUF2235 family)
MKNLVVCCDGTWNEPDEQRDHVARPTNVAKLALALVSDVDKKAEEQRQLVHYELGVGTSPSDHLVGGAFGVGISKNICDGYRFLAEHYEPEDKVYLFGFSRGAYTARSLSGLIHNCGILEKDNVDQVDAAYAFYRDRTNQSHPKTIAARIFRESYSHGDSGVHCIGVWDTVGALGIPQGLPLWSELAKAFPGWEQLWGFHDTRLSPDVKFAFHALAIDEERPMYEPTLWTKDVKVNPDQKVEQVWFAGVHSEVGGGTHDSALSDIAFLWMVEKVLQAVDPEEDGDTPLLFREGQPQAGEPDIDLPAPVPNYAGNLTQSRRGIWETVHPLHRLTSPQVRDEGIEQSVASSAKHRYEKKVERYAPPGLDRYLETYPIEATPEGN